MRTSILAFRSLVALVLLAGLATTARADDVRAATMAPFPKPPTIDGKMSPGEWDYAVGTWGFQTGIRHRSLDFVKLAPRKGRTWVGFTTDALYIAQISELPPTGDLITTKEFRDAETIFDDGIEIWIDPNRDTRGTGKGDLDYYQFIGTPAGVIYDLRFDARKGAPDTGWNGNWEFKNNLDQEAGLWITEIRLPWKDVGMKPGEALFGKSIGVLVSRNFKRPWSQNTWFSHSGAFLSFSQYPRLYMTKDQPVVQVVTLGEKIHQAHVDMAVQIVNPGPARKARVQMRIDSTDMPTLRDQKVMDLPANGKVMYEWKTEGERLHAQAQHTMSFVVSDPDTERPFMKWGVVWTRAGRKWNIGVAKLNPQDAVKFAYYPSYHFLRVRIDPNELGKEGKGIQSAKVLVKDLHGKTVLDEQMKWEKAPAVQELKFAKPLEAGEYILTVTLDGYKEPFTRTFKRIIFPWENSNFGVTRGVYPPFTPITVDGDKVGVVLREHKVGPLGLWDSVKSLDREILTGPMTLRTADGKALKGEGEWTEKRNDMVVYEAESAHPAVKVKTRCTTEYDGCTKVELELLPGAEKQELDGLYLDIPVRDDIVSLFHCSTTSLRFNPAGAVPKGTGKVWDSTMFADGTWYGNFKPYLWIGGEERGLCWFADNDRGWVLDIRDPAKGDADPCLSLHREGETLSLRVHLVQKPVLIQKPRKIVFGLMASPAKPMRDDWRTLLFARRLGHLKLMAFTMCYAADGVYSCKYPSNRDFSVFAKMQAMRLGTPVENFWENWLANNEDKWTPYLRNERFEHLSEVLKRVSRMHPDYFTMYFEEFHSTHQTHPESHVFQSEWTGNYHMNLIDKVTSEGYRFWSIPSSSITESYQDFACYYAAQWIRYGIGIYFDNAFPHKSYDLTTTSAYVMDNGRVQASADMWARREYLKRIWVLHQQYAPVRTKPIMMIHMTNTHILPYMGWNEANLDLEWGDKDVPLQAQWPPELLRAESIGRQTGNVPIAIATVRNRVPALLVHEIGFFGWGTNFEFMQPWVDMHYGLPECDVYNYWIEDPPLKASDEKAKWLLLKHKDELMVLTCTWNPQPAEVTFTFDTKRLGVNPTTATAAGRKLKKGEKPETWPVKGGKLTIPLKGYGWQMVRLK